LLFESVGQQCAISYAARADKKFQNFHGARFLPPASPHIDETSSFYFFWRGGLWMRRGAKGDSEAVYLVCLVYLVERNQRNQKDQINQIPATRWEMCDCKTRGGLKKQTCGLRVTGLLLKLLWAAIVQCLVEALAVVEHLGVNPSDTSSGNPFPFLKVSVKPWPP
jgi:hypothetical protein